MTRLAYDLAELICSAKYRSSPTCEIVRSWVSNHLDMLLCIDDHFLEPMSRGEIPDLDAMRDPASQHIRILTLKRKSASSNSVTFLPAATASKRSISRRSTQIENMIDQTGRVTHFLLSQMAKMLVEPTIPPVLAEGGVH